MKKLLYVLMILSLLVGGNVQIAAQSKQPTKEQIAKQKAKEKAAKEKEKAKAKAAKEKEKAKAAQAKEKAAQAKEKEQAKAAQAKEKEKAAQEKEKERAREAAIKEKEQEKKAAAKAKVQAEKEREVAKKEAEAEKLRQAYYKQQEELTNPKEKPIHYFNLSPRVGYAAMMDKGGKINLAGQEMKNTLLGGAGLGVGITYNLEYKHFLFETGLDFEILNSTSRYDGYDITRLDNQTKATYHYLNDRTSETRHDYNVGLPVMFGATFNDFYFLVGARIGYDVYGSYMQKGQYDIVVEDPGLLEPYGLGIHELPSPADKKLSFKAPDVKVCAEIGLDLDKWLQKQPTEEKQKMKLDPGQRYPFGREHIHYRVGLFAEYGVLNTNNCEPKMPMEFENNRYEAQRANTMLAQEGSKLNNLFVGAKFTIQFEVPGKTPAVVPAPPSFADITIEDSETNEKLKIAMARITNVNTKKEPMKQKTLNKGVARQKLPLGEYILDIQADGYYGQTITFAIDSVDQLVKLPVRLVKIPAPKPVEIVPEVVEKGETFVVKNLYFATNKTIILPISEPAMHELAEYLNRHPDIRVKVIGHTDSVGKDKANMKLSEGRAKAVRENLIERGIAADRLEAEGRGETQPIDTNDTEEGRQNNRRVEIEIL